jgi:hypothetical protein
MTTTPAVLAPQQFVPDAATKAHTAAGVGSWIDHALFANVGGAPASITVHLVPSGGAVGDDTKAVPPFNIAPGATTTLPDLVGRFLVAGDELWWTASLPDSINGAITGRAVT